MFSFVCLQVTFEQVGGMGKHIRALKEMIVFPLLYPEVFDRFKIAPPRGVLFYGPPGMVWQSMYVFHPSCNGALFLFCFSVSEVIVMLAPGVLS